MWGAAAQEQPAILVVDDDRVIRGWLADVLSGAGYAVLDAADGQDALCRIAEHGVPSLILLDVMMPRMNGLLLLQTLRGASAYAAIPVVMLSALGPQRMSPYDASISAWLDKPVEIDVLLETVELYRERLAEA